MPADQPPLELPDDDTVFGPTRDEITAELLDLTWCFLTKASPAVRDELRAFLTSRGHHRTAGLEAFLDTLQFTAAGHRHDADKSRPSDP